MADKSGLTKHRRALTKFWLSARIPIVVGIVAIIIAVAGSFGYGKFKAAQKAEHDEAAKQAVSSISEQVEAGMKRAQQSVKAILDEQQLAQVVAAGEADAIAAAEQALTRGADVVIAATLLPAGYDELDRGVDPPVGYAVLDMLRKSVSNGEALPPEVHLFNDEARHIAWLVRLIGADGELKGHARLALDIDLIKRAVQGLKVESGYAELIQPLAKGKPLVLVQLGNEALRKGVPSRAAPVPETAWRVTFWTASSAPPSSGGGDTMMPIVGVIVVVLLAVGFVLLHKRKAAVPAEPAPAEAAPVKTSAPVPTPTPEDGLDPLDIGPPPLPEVDSDDVPTAAEEPAVESTPTPAGVVAAEIFRAYDIRGVVGKSLTVESVNLIGKALGSEAYDRGQQTIVVGYDGRLSGPELAGALIEGLRATGRDVIDIGRVPTPVLYFATHYLNTSSGVIVTGSHNPPDYNGLKIMLGGETLFGDAIQALHTRIQAGEFQDGDGSLQTMDVLPEYIRRVTEDVPVALGNAFKVVVDCGNGVAGEVAPKLIRALGHDVIELFCEVDGNFPNHHPDPSKPENLADLISAIQDNEADIGFAFDGDGDRLGVVDATGKVLWPDLQMMLYARDILSRNPGAQIVYDVKCTNRLGKVIKKLGGEPLMWKTGHSFIKSKMRETGALLAGEMSGHIFFKERWYGFDDAMYAAARLLELLLGFKQPPAEIFAKLPTGITTPELNLNMAEGEPHPFMDELVAAASFADGKISTVDGLRVDYKDGWGLVRASNTTPCLVLRFEADDQAALERIQGEFRTALLAQNPDLELPF